MKVKLDPDKIRWIVRQKERGGKNETIASTMNISVSWMKKIYSKYKGIPKKDIKYPMRMGRPKGDTLGRREHSLILSTYADKGRGAVSLEEKIMENEGMHIPHNAIHRVLLDGDIAGVQPRKSGRRKWIRYEREHSNSMWHTDYKLLDDGRWLLSYQDDASRFITGFGVFEHATSANAIRVLHKAIKKHGKPASILTDRGSQFYATGSDVKAKGVSEFEKELVRLEIKHILARVNHPQTNGKIERFHGEVQRHLPRFRLLASGKSTRGPDTGHVGGPFYRHGSRDPIELLIEWYNERRPHMSLDEDVPANAFVKKMCPDVEEATKVLM